MRFLLALFCCLVALNSPVSAQPKVVAVAPDSGGLGDTVTVTVSSPCSNTAWLPYLDGFALHGSVLQYCDSAAAGNSAWRFTLLRKADDETSRKAWNNVLAGWGKPTRTLRVSAGPKDGPPLPSEVEFRLIVYPVLQSWLALIALVGIFALFLVIALKTDMLRDPPRAPGEPRTWSISRCQMAWWLFIILTSFLDIWLITGDLNMPASSLILLGITSATAIFAGLVDPKPTKSGITRGSLGGLIAGKAEDVTFFRFQFFAWTIVLGLVFIFRVVAELAQPVFNETLLSLMGISSGVYLGYKVKPQ